MYYKVHNNINIFQHFTINISGDVDTITLQIQSLHIYYYYCFNYSCLMVNNY